MLPEIVTFNKSMQYRLQEYEQLFDGLETPCSEITEVWGSIFEDLAVIGVGWQALWVLSERNCRKYNLLYPSAVIVKIFKIFSKTDLTRLIATSIPMIFKVNEFHWSELMATIKVLAVQEDIVIPSVIEAAVTELHPIKVQDYDETDLKDIEDWLDKCRYFFKYLWYPWDAKFNVNMMDWCESHLRNRLKMQCDMKNGVFDKTIANYLKLLLAEAQNISDISEKGFSQEDDRLTVVRRYIRRKIIKTELDLFEEPDLRYGMILLKRKQKHLRNSTDKNDWPEVKFVWMNGTSQSLIHYLGMAKAMIDENSPLKVFCSLQEALDSSGTNDTVILPPGVHVMSSFMGIECGGFIKGLDNNETVIKPDTTTIPRAILFECFGFIEMENLTISKPNGIAIQIFNGTVKLKNCRIFSDENNSTSRGIVVVSGCRLILENCELQGFGTAIALQADTHATVKDTKISECFEGIKVTENANLSLQNVAITLCSMFGIRLESSNVESDCPLIGDLNLLGDNSVCCNITLNSVTFDGNGKGNVVIKQNEPALNFEEPSQSDLSNEIIYISDKEDLGDSSVEEIQTSFNKAL